MMTPLNNLIADHHARKNRQIQKEKAVLIFLRQHIWSNQEILQQVMGLKSRQAAHKTLSAMESQGTLRRYVYDALGGKFTAWGITSQGQAMAFNPETESVVPNYFEPGRVSEQTIRHQLDLQKLRLKAEYVGWTSWTDGDRLENLGKNDKRPDAIVLNPSNQMVAIECERTFKSLKRYEQILVNYLKLIKSGQINLVVWISPTNDMALRLKKIFTDFSVVRVNGQSVLIEPEKHHKNIYFCSYAEWPDYE